MNTLDDLLNSLNHEEIKQKEFISLYTQRCEPYRKQRTFGFMGFKGKLPEVFYMSFTLTNDHIERDDCKWKVAVFNFENLGLN